MSSFILIALLACIPQANAEELRAKEVNDSQNSMDEFADELVDELANRLLTLADHKASVLHNADLDTTTLGKPGSLEIPPQARYHLAPSFQSSLQHMIFGGQEQEDVHTLADNDDQQQIFDWVLGVRGGAKKTPMKSPSKSPMKSPMKSPSKSPMKSPMKSPSKSPMKSPMKSPSKSPMKSPAKSPPAKKVKLATPMKNATSPAKSPMKSPMKSPILSPMKSPMATVVSPAKSPKK